MSKLKLYIKNSAHKARQETTADSLKKINLPKNAKYLDIGCHCGEITATNAKKMGISLVNTYGVDNNEELLRQASALFNTAKINIEEEHLPYPDGYFDIIVISEVFEHLKNINFVLGEVRRVLKPGGFLLVSTPNLAASHNRILLLFGRQPRCMNVFVGTHVRGFTLPTWKKLLRLEGFQIIKISGAGLYPVWGILANIIVKLFPSFAVFLIILSKKHRK